MGLASKNRGIAGAVRDGPLERGLEAGRREPDTRRSLLPGKTLDEIDAARRRTS